MGRDLVSFYAVVAAVVAGLHSYRVLAQLFAGAASPADFCRRLLELDDGALASFIVFSAILVVSAAVLLASVAWLIWQPIRLCRRSFRQARGRKGHR
jgi:hypothetical protein